MTTGGYWAKTNQVTGGAWLRLVVISSPARQGRVQAGIEGVLDHQD